MEKYNDKNYLSHYGILGMKWGVRRYQNKDGSLTAAGKKRYDSELAKVKAEEAKNKAQQKVLDTRKKTQAKLDDLEARKKAVEVHKKAMKEEEKALRSSRRKIEPKAKKQKEETVEERRERLLKSVDPKELYANRHLLTNDEIQNRLNRINLEAQLVSKIPVEKKVSTTEKLNDALSKLTKTYKNIDDAYSAVTKSSIGKQVSEALGLNKKEEKEFDLDKFVKDINKKSNKEIQDTRNRLKNEQDIYDIQGKRRIADNEEDEERDKERNK